MDRPEIVFALYKPQAGHEKELEKLVSKHFPTLKKYGLVTNRHPTVVRSKNGTIIEIFEWKSSAATREAHEHPAIAKIWEAMEKISTFVSLDSLEEAKKAMAHFEPIAI
ncbi:MAG: hypothetical protein HY052_04965 [Proteobacteria bacterium]|nr:hypothetical protein [Pseudomonadota bacterium]